MEFLEFLEFSEVSRSFLNFSKYFDFLATVHVKPILWPENGRLGLSPSKLTQQEITFPILDYLNRINRLNLSKSCDYACVARHVVHNGGLGSTLSFPI